MHLIIEIIRSTHVAFGFIGLAAFWIPVFAKKGAVNHVRFGKVFVWSAYIVLAGAAIGLTATLTELVLSGVTLTDESVRYAFVAFLAYLIYITYASVHYGMAVLRSKRNPTEVGTHFNKTVAYGAILASVALILYAFVLSPPNKVLLLALSPIGLAIGSGNLRYMNRPPASPRAWFYEHLGAMLGSGIAFHTAFAVFGISQLFDIGLTGWAAMVPWVAPSAIGIPAIFLFTRHYRHKFGELRVAT